MIKKRFFEKLGVSALSLLLSVSLLPMANFADSVKAIEDTTIASPALGDTVTWDCIYFGSYPQSEITKEFDADTYQLLQSSNDWNNNIISINDVVYKRIQKEDATSTGASYHWSKDNDYHYFKFEPIKWRVIEVNGTSAYMISDMALDTQKYNSEAKDVTWNNSSLRSWLNGYAPSENQPAVDYSLNNFLDTAFRSTEQDSIISTNNDKVTILSEEDLKNNKVYGLDTQNTRICKTSTYAIAMGAHEDALGACNYWTSTNGNSNLTAKFIKQSGDVYTKGYSVVYAGNAIRAVVTINLEKTDCYRYAGTVSSDGTVTEPVVTATPAITPITGPAITTTEPTFTVSPTAPSTVVPTETAKVTTAKPSAIPTQTTSVTTMVPTKETIAPTAVSTVAPTKTTPTTVPTKETFPVTAVPTKEAGTATVAPTTTVAPTSTIAPVKTSIKKGSVYSHTTSNGKYRVTKINKTTAKDGTIGTVTFIKPIKKTKTSASIPATVTIKKCKLKVTAIEKNAFANNKKLKKVVIGKNITKINGRAFKACKKLSRITIKTTGLTKKSIGKNAFKQINAKAIIQVPDKKVTSYKKWLKSAGVGKSVVFKKLK